MPAPQAWPVTTLPPEEAASAAETLLRAFTGDPGVEYMIPKPARQARIMRGMLLASVRYGLRWGEVHTVVGKGVAIWVPPPGKGAVTYARLMRAGMLRPVLSCGPGEVFRSLVLGLHSGLLDTELLRRPHWYLWVLGVEPEAQGTGVGSALLRHMLERADVKDRPCALETMKETNLRFYEKHGFRVSGHGSCPLNGPPVWTMRRMKDEG